MDGLSAAASGLAVVSVAIQLAEVCIRLHHFWESVRDAPKEVALITHDLRLLSSILEEIDRCGPHSATVTMGLDSCLVKVQRLSAIVADFDHDFRSTSRRERLWGALKASTRTKQLDHFRESLNDTKCTLMLGILCQSIQSPKRRLLQGGIPDENLPIEVPPPYSPYREPRQAPMPTPAKGKKELSQKIPPSEKALSDPSSKANTTIRKLFQKSMQTAVDNFLTSGALEELFADSIGQITEYEAQSCGTFTPDDYQMDPQLHHDPRKPYADFSRASRICHRTSSVGLLFGKVWRRTSTLRLATKSGSTASGEFEITTSFIFYPCSLATMTGLGRGVEASLKNSRSGWKFDFNPIRAVPDNSLIFELCTDGDWTGVQRLLQRQDASLKDTNSKGWTPLHFAAQAGHVELCDMLLRSGADKRALVFEGPTKDALSPVTIFVTTNSGLPAQHKINMLRLFTDCLELTDPSGDGWTVHAELKRSYNKEKVPIPENSVSWLLRATASEEFIVFGPKTIWTALQSSVRSFLVHERNEEMLQRLLGLSEKDRQSVNESHATCIAQWLALRASEGELLPMIVDAGRLCNITGFDWVQDELTPREFVRTLPVIYHAWALAFPNNVDQAESQISAELRVIMERGKFRVHDFLVPTTGSNKQDPDEKEQKRELRCSVCDDDYTQLGIGVVSPAWISFVECTKTNHVHRCDCSSYLAGCGFLPPASHRTVSLNTPVSEYVSPFQDEDEEDFQGIPPSLDIPQLCEDYIASDAHLTNTYDPFTEAATMLYRAQGRIWLGAYREGEAVCGTCFLQGERYIGENGLGTEGDFPDIPDSYSMCRVGEGVYCFDKD